MRWLAVVDRLPRPSLYRRAGRKRELFHRRCALTLPGHDGPHQSLCIMKGKFMKRPTVHEKAMVMIGAWRDRCAGKTFFRMSLGDFSTLVAPSGAARERIAKLRAELREAIKQCENADRITRRAIVQVVNGVKGDPDEGEDGDLLSAMGYMKHTVRAVMLSAARRRSARAAAGDGTR
jgi:hypothetical protein